MLYASRHWHTASVTSKQPGGCDLQLCCGTGCLLSHSASCVAGQPADAARLGAQSQVKSRVTVKLREKLYADNLYVLAKFLDLSGASP
jgi:hypothetical protein